MENLEEENRHLREKNNQLVQELQFLKITAAQKEREKLDLMREINELRLKLGRIRSGGAAQARKLEVHVQAASEEALSHLVQASGAVARTLELAKQFLIERQELDSTSTWWNAGSGPPSTEKVHRVPPLLLGGQSIQPVVSLSRTLLNHRPSSTAPNPNSVQDRAVPMHMLQDVYIPLRRIDMAELQAHNVETEEDRDNSAEDLGLDDSNNQSQEEPQNLSAVNEMEESNEMEDAMEDVKPEILEPPQPRNRVENPLEGPSWLLDVPNTRQEQIPTLVNLEPDSTTSCEEARSPSEEPPAEVEESEPLSVTLAFTPTVRRRKRDNTPPPLSPRPPHPTNDGRILKVVVAKMRLSDDDPRAAGDSPSPKRPTPVPPEIPNTPPVANMADANESSSESDSDTSSNESVVNTSKPEVSQPNRSKRPLENPQSPAHSSPPKRRMPEPPEESSSDSEDSQQGDSSPPRLGKVPPKNSSLNSRQFDAPSPNGSTDAAVVVSESERRQPESVRQSRVPRRRDSRESRDGRDSARSRSGSDSSAACDLLCEGRTRRARKNITYTEKPLNRKLRR